MRIMRFYNVIHYVLWEHLVLAKCELEISRLDSGFKYRKDRLFVTMSILQSDKIFLTKKNSFPPIDGSLVSLREISN